MLLGKIVSFQPVVHYNQIYLVLIGIVAFMTQLQLLHLLRYHKTISILGSTLSNATWDLLSFGMVMGVIFFAFTITIYFLYHDISKYRTMIIAMGTQVMTSVRLIYLLTLVYIHFNMTIDMISLWLSVFTRQKHKIYALN